MMTKAIRRLEFYTRKVNELGAIHVTVRDARWRRRAIRLQKYKTAIKAELRVESLRLKRRYYES